MSTALAEMPRPPRRDPDPRPVHVATTRNLTTSYGAIVALRNLNLEVRSGELLALLGPNGAGKTTLVRMLLGVARPDAGSVSVFGADPHGGRVQPRLGAMLQVGRVPETLRVREHIDLFSSYYPAPPAAAGDLSDRRHRGHQESSLRRALRRPETAGVVRHCDLRQS